MTNGQSGRYVRIEGPDGTGKSTQIAFAKQYCADNGMDVVFVREPGGTDLAERLRHILQIDKSLELSAEEEVLLLTTSRLNLWRTVIEPALAQGKTVISDRGIESTLCFQAAGGGVTEETIMGISKQVLPERYLRPDALAVLSISPETKAERIAVRARHIELDKIELRDADYADRVREAYDKLHHLPYAVVIDAEPGPDEIFKQLKPILFG